MEQTMPPVTPVEENMQNNEMHSTQPTSPVAPSERVTPPLQKKQAGLSTGQKIFILGGLSVGMLIIRVIIGAIIMARQSSYALQMPYKQYPDNEHAIKYAFLIVVLIYAATFFAEVRKHKPLHIVHYLLIGLGVMEFYPLLLSFSELMPFGGAYLIASTMTVGLITTYLVALMKDFKVPFLIGLLLCCLYALIYLKPSAGSYTLLIVSLLIFVVLAAVMYVSLKLNKKTESK